MQYRPEETTKYVTRHRLAAGHFGAFCVQVAVEERQQLRFPEEYIMRKKNRDKVKTQELNDAITRELKYTWSCSKAKPRRGH